MKMRRVALALGFFCGLGSSLARADVIRLFNVEGSFDNGSALSGTLQIDTTSGMVEAVDLMTTGTITDTYKTIFDQGYSAKFGNYFVQANDSGSVHDVSLGFGTNSLVGYSGGMLTSKANPSSNNYVTGLDHTYSLLKGSVSAVPLPASAPMFGAGLIALGAAGYAAKRKRAAAA